MTERDADLNLWTSLIKGEYQEMPGLQLTRAQVRRMWGLTESDCERVLGALQAASFLRLTRRGCYVLAGSERGDAMTATPPVMRHAGTHPCRH